MMDNLNKKADDGSLKGQTFSSGGKSYKVAITDNFSYTDPIDKSVSKNQVCLVFSNWYRIYDDLRLKPNKINLNLSDKNKG